MRYIYTQADQVVVWLGAESDDSDLAIDFIEILDQTMRQEKYTVDEIRSRLQDDQYCPHWTALTSFLSRRWWSRIWTIQEFVIPPTLSFWCGNRDVSRMAVFRSLSAADRCTSVGIKETRAFRCAFNRKRVWDLYVEAAKRGKGGKACLSLPLVPLVAYFSCMDATNDRDRLYGLRALATDGDHLDVDYSLSVQEVYLRFAQAFIERHKSLDIMCFATVHSVPLPDPADQRPSPSWVPDWHRQDAFLSMPVMVSQSASVHVGNMRPARYREDDASVRYTASGNKDAIYEFKGSSLLAQGVVVGEVDGLAGFKDSEIVQSSSSRNSTIEQQSEHYLNPEHRQSAIGVLRHVCNSLVLGRRDRFLRSPAPGDEFFRDFAALCAPMIKTPEPQSQSIPTELQEWYHGAKALQIYGNTFEDILREGLRADTSYDSAGPAPNQDEYFDDTFFGRFYDTVIRMSLRLMVSRDGRIGMVPQKAMKGDLICVLYGCSVPVLLRDGAGDNGFLFVGECFLDGCMDGSILEEPGLLERMFLIR
ncbi:hypothetical protein PG999_008545 [Apiospora kogelbergensis]|uniref:Heterokaryon incompatibility domain-containing protein n=1 Tax=Apiospora kogelbergensis TaxID=1337665 RepID=A0AAW0QSH3_9PEZI